MELTITQFEKIAPYLPRQRGSEHEQSSIGERDSVCHGKRLQMESTAEILWKLAYRLCSHESLE